ncbi:hypothetical protein [Corynebacterium sp. AOP40-4SA-5]|uniref:hypothetical protein n=1 Tax=Corynebacterium sp. AOP40-4SA-5 TaxID=3457678 RepID=UPI0040348DE1
MNTTPNNRRAEYELNLIRLTAELSFATADERDQIQQQIDHAKNAYFGHHRHELPAKTRSTFTRPVTTPKKPQKRQKPPKMTISLSDIVARPVNTRKQEKEAAQDMRDVLNETSCNPYKTNDRKDDMRYQTHGIRNHRAKKRF